MKIVDALDFLPTAWSENTKAKLTLWILLAVIFIIICGLSYFIVDLYGSNKNQNTDIGLIRHSIDTMRVKDSLRTIEQNKFLNELRVTIIAVKVTVDTLKKKDSLDTIGDAKWDSAMVIWMDSFKKNEERKRKFDERNPELAPSK